MLKLRGRRVEVEILVFEQLRSVAGVLLICSQFDAEILEGFNRQTCIQVLCVVARHLLIQFRAVGDPAVSSGFIEPVAARLNTSYERPTRRAESFTQAHKFGIGGEAGYYSIEVLAVRKAAFPDQHQRTQGDALCDRWFAVFFAFRFICVLGVFRILFFGACFSGAFCRFSACVAFWSYPFSRFVVAVIFLRYLF